MSENDNGIKVYDFSSCKDNSLSAQGLEKLTLDRVRTSFGPDPSSQPLLLFQSSPFSSPPITFRIPSIQLFLSLPLFFRSEEVSIS